MKAAARSLQGRLVLLTLATTVLLWVAAALVAWTDARHELDELLDGHLAQAAALLVAQQTAAPDAEDHTLDAPRLHRYAPKVAFQVFHEGRLALRSSNAPHAPMVAPEAEFHSGFRTVALGSDRWRVFAAQGSEGDVQVYVAERMTSRTEILQAVLRASLAPMVLVLPLLGLATWWAVRRSIRPLRDLAADLRARTPQSLQPVALPDAPTEIEPVVQSLNRLLGRIAALLESERRFTADAAHELRTPIAAIRTQAQVALAETGPLERRHALEATIAGCDRAARLIDQLMTLSRLESGAIVQSGDVDLVEVVRSAVAEVAPQGIAKGQRIDFRPGEPCHVLGDAGLLGVLVRNLVDNAVRYSPPQARVRVSLRHGPAQAQLRIEDSGAGMADIDRSRLGERFFRVLGTGQPGSGLGWSIVRRIAAAQGGQVTVSESRELGGLAVDVALPLHG
jgi:two-component system, OmpR family, sensor histidine kinase QseC